MDTFVVFDPTDRYHASVCIGEDDVRDVIPFFKATVTVLRVTEGNLARDVSADFREEPEPDFEPVPYRAPRWSLGDWHAAAQRRSL